MRRGDIFRTEERVAERGHKPGFYVIVSRSFIAESPDVSTVICAPVYSQILGVSTEVGIGPDEGLPHECAIRCDFLTLLFKRRLTRYVGRLGSRRIAELNAALAQALALAGP